MKEEWKNKHVLIGVFVYIFTAVLITYLSLPGIDKAQYAALFWLILIFTTLNGIAKSFIGMKKGHFVFWHQLLNPQQFLLSKLIASFLLMFLFTTVAFLLFLVIHGNVSENNIGFFVVSVLTGAGVSFIFTISSSIASKTDSPGMLLPVLSFPLVIPVLLIGTKGAKKALDDLGLMVYLPEIFLLIGFNILIVTMGLFLIKFIWKE